MGGDSHCDKDLETLTQKQRHSQKLRYRDSKTTDNHIQTDKERQRKTLRQTETQRERQIVALARQRQLRKTGLERETQRERGRDRQTDIQMGTEREADIESKRERQRETQETQTDRQRSNEMAERELDKDHFRSLKYEQQTQFCAV